MQAGGRDSRPARPPWSQRPRSKAREKVLRVPRARKGHPPRAVLPLRTSQVFREHAPPSTAFPPKMSHCLRAAAKRHFRRSGTELAAHRRTHGGRKPSPPRGAGSPARRPPRDKWRLCGRSKKARPQHRGTAAQGAGVRVGAQGPPAWEGQGPRMDSSGDRIQPCSSHHRQPRGDKARVAGFRCRPWIGPRATRVRDTQTRVEATSRHTAGPLPSV